MSNVIAAFTENIFSEILSEVQMKEKVFIIKEKTEPMDHGFKLTYSGSFKIKGGSISFLNNDIIEIKDLKIVFEELWVKLNVKFKKLCLDVPCKYLPTSLKCITNPDYTKRHCILQGDPTRSTGDINIASLIKPHVSMRIRVSAENKGDKWIIQGYLKTDGLDIDLLGSYDIISQLLYDKIKKLVKDNLPRGKIKDFFLHQMGQVEGIIEKVTDYADNIEDGITKWFLDKWGMTKVLEILLLQDPVFDEIFKIDNPYEIMKEKIVQDKNCTCTDITLPSVKAPLSNVAISIEHNLMKILADFHPA